MVRHRRALGRGAGHRAGERARGERFTLEDALHGSFAAAIPALGRHNVYDALAAHAAATPWGLSPPAARRPWRISGRRYARQRIVRYKEGLTVIEDCYNASPDSMRARALPCSRGLPQKTAENLPCWVICWSLAALRPRPTPRWAGLRRRPGLRACGLLAPPAAAWPKRPKRRGWTPWCQTPAQALEQLQRRLRPGDALLAKASRGMKLENILKALYGEQALQ